MKKIQAKFNATVGTPVDENGVGLPRPVVYEIRCDHEGGLESQAFLEFRTGELIHQSFSPPAIKLQCGAPASFWPYSKYIMRHAVNIHNLTSSSVGSSTADPHISPEYRFTLRQPEIMDLGTFGCRC
eukprot:2124098-Prymnesium_polylepis.1